MNGKDIEGWGGIMSIGADSTEAATGGVLEVSSEAELRSLS